MALMYVSDSGFRAPKIDGLLPHFVVLHRMMRRMLVLRIGDSNAIPTYEWNLLDVIMKNENFDVFNNIMDEIWNIAIKPLQSCGFAPFIICMIETVAHERFYKDVAHEPLHPALPKLPICHHTSPLDVVPSHSTRSSGASSSSSANFGILKMFWGIFTMCHHTDQRMDVLEHRTNILRRN
jgi:hypothetical protein